MCTRHPFAVAPAPGYEARLLPNLLSSANYMYEIVPPPYYADQKEWGLLEKSWFQVSMEDRIT